MATNKPRFTITLDTTTLNQVLAYKDNNKLSTQSKAIQRLIEIGIKETLHSGQESEGAETALLPDESELIDIYRSLNRDGKSTLIATARGFAGNPAMKEEKYSSETA